MCIINIYLNKEIEMTDIKDEQLEAGMQEMCEEIMAGVIELEHDLIVKFVGKCWEEESSFLDLMKTGRFGEEFTYLPPTVDENGERKTVVSWDKEPTKILTIGQFTVTVREDEDTIDIEVPSETGGFE